MSVLVNGGVIEWIRPADSEEDPGDAEVIDAGGATIVPGMVDCHSHLELNAVSLADAPSDEGRGLTVPVELAPVKRDGVGRSRGIDPSWGGGCWAQPHVPVAHIGRVHAPRIQLEVACAKVSSI